jgi:hypothetical protein
LNPGNGGDHCASRWLDGTPPMANPNQDKWQRALHREERRFRNRHATAFFNGWLLIVASPLMMLIGTAQAVKEYGPLGSLFGWIAGAIFLVPGMLAVRHSKRMRRPAWLENLRSRETASADPPQSPPSTDEAGG